MVHSVVTYALEKCLSFLYKWKIVHKMADFVVSRNYFHLFRFFHERHELLQKVKLVDNEDKFLNRHLNLCVNQNSNCTLKVLGVYFIVFSIFLMNPVFNIKLFMILPYIFHLLLYRLNQFYVLLWNRLFTWPHILQIRLSIFIGFINFMIIVFFNHFLKVYLFFIIIL